MDNSIVPPVPPRRPAPMRGLGFALPLITLSWLVLFGAIAMAAVRIQRFELAPGEAMAVAPRIEFAKSSTGTEVPEFAWPASHFQGSAHALEGAPSRQPPF